MKRKKVSKSTLNIRLTSLLLLGSVALAGCSSTPEQSSNVQSNVQNTAVATQAAPASNQAVVSSTDDDFFDGFNRAMWSFNYNYLDPYFVRPISIGYGDYMPKPIRTGVSNFLSNLDEPASFISNLFMGNFDEASRNFSRFVANTVFGIGGIFDVATIGGIEKTRDREFGDVLGHYGVGKGAYIMAPVYGPFVIRDTADIVNPNYFLLDFWGSFGKWALQGIEDRYALVGREDMLNNSPDPYAFVRNAYLQSLDFDADITEDDVPIDEELLDEYLDR